PWWRSKLHCSPHFDFFGRKVQLGGHYPDDSEDDLVEIDRPLNRSRITAEVLSPKAIADYRDSGRSGLVFIWIKGPAEGGLDPKRRKKVCGDSGATYSFG